MVDQEIRATVLKVLAGQSPGYLIHPDAAAFIAEGLDADTVTEMFDVLEREGHAQGVEEVALRYKVQPLMEPVPVRGKFNKLRKQTVLEQALDHQGNPVFEHVIGEDGRLLTEPATDEQGNEIVIHSGWEITESGRTEATRLRKLEEQ